MLSDLNWETLATRRSKIKLCTFYNIHHAPRIRTHELAYFEISTSTAYYNTHSTQVL